MGVDLAHFAFAEIDLLAIYAPEIAGVKTTGLMAICAPEGAGVKTTGFVI